MSSTHVNETIIPSYFLHQRESRLDTRRCISVFTEKSINLPSLVLLNPALLATAYGFVFLRTHHAEGAETIYQSG